MLALTGGKGLRYYDKVWILDNQNIVTMLQSTYKLRTHTTHTRLTVTTIGNHTAYTLIISCHMQVDFLESDVR